MKPLFIPTPVSKRLRRSQRGQSIVLLAFAFIALVAFVGLVTDVALLFVRYAALRRAVDAAAIAAAGQIREGTDYGEVAVAAEQYLELHNLDSQSILVETCETDIYQWRSGFGPWEGDPHPEAAYPKVADNMAETELCDWDDPHKLVRVSAQIESPTTFLSLIGIGNITLSTTSVSETAVLDVALVIDTSESMAKETQTSHYTAINIDHYLGTGTLNVRPECYTTDDDVNIRDIDPLARERWEGCCNDPGQGSVSDGNVRKAGGGFLINGYIWHDVNANGMWDGTHEDGVSTTAAASTSLTDPDGFNFTTLICRPFKDVKDAARLFIKQLDFVRGDRVVLVTFDRNGVAYDPDGDDVDQPLRPMIRSERVAIDTLNLKIGVLINKGDSRLFNLCEGNDVANAAWAAWRDGSEPVQPALRPVAYETIASCGNTNVGGGILAANNALTDPIDIRREAVWVMIVLSDGAANVTNPTRDAVNQTDYGFYGYCPWWTFCLRGDRTTYDSAAGWGNGSGYYQNFSDPDDPYLNGLEWPECTETNPSQPELAAPVCNDDDPATRHFCIDWNTGEPETGNPDCSSTGHYDADDYARDMADFAGLIEVVPDGKKGNFIAIFSIGFGDEVEEEKTAAPLLRYLADAGDNGFIDNNFQQDWRDNRQLDFGDYRRYGDPDPCERTPELYPTEQCGQYYFANNVSTLTAVFEDIASRMFTRLSR
ncbi:MAG: hypothetical protein HY866_07185 [Chloroflexi bacterium]|nr:hypothetical protein [Chloroflexota bacterium]